MLINILEIFKTYTSSFIEGHRSLAVRAYKRTSKELEESVFSILYGNSTPSKKMAVQVKQNKPEESVKEEETKLHENMSTKKTDKKRTPHNITINFNLS